MTTEPKHTLHDIQKRLRFIGTLRRAVSGRNRTEALVYLVIDGIWNRGNVEMADALFTDDYVNHGGLIPNMVRGPRAVKFSAILYRIAFPRLQLAIDEVTADDDAVLLRWVAHTGHPPNDVPPARPVSLRGTTRCRLQSGKVAETWTHWDTRADLVRVAAIRRELTRDAHLMTV